jgi:hypothetical protein
VTLTDSPLAAKQEFEPLNGQYWEKQTFDSTTGSGPKFPPVIVLNLPGLMKASVNIPLAVSNIADNRRIATADFGEGTT